MWSRDNPLDFPRAGAVVVLLALMVWVTAGCGPSPIDTGPSGDVPPILTFEKNGLLFTYHVPTNTEGLFDMRLDPRRLKNLLGERPFEAETLRRLLCQKMGVPDLKELMDADDPMVRQLRGLGYL